MIKLKAALSSLALATVFSPALIYAQGNPTGMPNALNVTVTNTPLPVTGNVTVDGTMNIRDVENPARQAVVASDSCDIPATLNCFLRFTVPDGKVLVVETVGVSSVGTIGARLYSTVSFALGGGANGRVTMPTAFVGTFGAFDVNAGTLSARLYAGPGTTVQIAGALTAAGTGQFSGSISGYLVDCGSGPGCSTP